LNGHRAAIAAGIKTLITVHDFTRHHDFEGAALVVDNLGEPHHPFTVISGDAGGATFADVGLLRRVHRRGFYRQTSRNKSRLVLGA
jgi:hypothetical protein